MNLKNLTIEQLEALKELKLKELREIETAINSVREYKESGEKVANKVPVKARRITKLNRVCNLATLQLLERNTVTLESWDAEGVKVLREYRELLRLIVTIVKNKEIVDVIDTMEELKSLHKRFIEEFTPAKNQARSVKALEERVAKLVATYEATELYKDYIAGIE